MNAQLLGDPIPVVIGRPQIAVFELVGAYHVQVFITPKSGTAYRCRFGLTANTLAARGGNVRPAAGRLANCRDASTPNA